jgi:uncharacterized protein YbjT (DUF2867 family)
MSARVVVFGATQGTGLFATQELLRRGYRVCVAARSPDKARKVFGDSVEIAAFDLTKPGPELDALLAGADHVLFTAAVPPGSAGEALLRATELDGLNAVLEACKRAGLAGRFVYMTTLGVYVPSLLSRFLDTLKWNMLALRREGEALMLASGLDVCIVRAGMLTDHAAGTAPIRLWTGDAPLVAWGRIARSDVGALLVDLLDVPGLRDVSTTWGKAEAPVPARLRELMA